MGFFSRLFKIREQDPSSPDTTWAVEDNGSELVLDAEYAATLMTEIDIDAAIASHERWRLQLQDMINGRSNEVMRPERICHDDRCDLGRWLYGTGRVRLGHYPAFDMLVARHKYFHQQAAEVVTLFQSGESQNRCCCSTAVAATLPIRCFYCSRSSNAAWGVDSGLAPRIEGVVDGVLRAAPGAVLGLTPSGVCAVSQGEFGAWGASDA